MSRMWRPSFLLATWGGAGLAPFAPGTVGTLAAVPVHFLLLPLPSTWHLAIVLGLVVLGTLAANAVAADMGQDDPQIIVVDESASILLALWIAIPAGWVGLAASIALFRLLDIYKPWPIHLGERLRPAGLGIMADDVLAGLVTGIAVRLGFVVLSGGGAH